MNHPSSEFDEAVAAACHGTGDAAQLEALAQLISQDDAALDDYIRKAELHASLMATSECGRAAIIRGGLHLGRPAVDRTARGHDRTVFRPIAPGMVAAFAAAAAVGLLMMLAFEPGRDVLARAFFSRPAPVAPAAEPEIVGTFGDFSAVVWVGSDVVAKPGDPIRAGQRLELANGSVRIDLTSGASVRLSGPAIFEIESPLAASLTMGRVRVTAGTPESKGFTIRTRTGRIVDLGTEFVAEAMPDGRCRVGVASGSVRVHLVDGDAGGGELLQEGDLLQVEPGRPRVMTRVERGDGSASFRFPSIEPPSSDDLADASRGRAVIRCVRGMLYENPSKQVTSAAPEILLDGKGQSGPDSPEESLYFADGEEGGLVLDLGAEVAVKKVNIYSWHRCLNSGFPKHLRQAHRERAAQHYVLYGRAGDPQDGAAGEQVNAGWTFIARVNSDEHFGLTGIDRPAQQASSVTAASGLLGRFRYLLFIVQPTAGMNHDGKQLEFGTFCGEIDVYGD